jgi:hypothetical protein
VTAPVKIAEVGPGTRLVAEPGFTCLHDGQVVTVRSDGGGLYVPCAHGKHRLDGQLSGDGTEYVGLSLAVPGDTVGSDGRRNEESVS